MITKVVKMNKTFFGEHQVIFLCLKYQQAVKILYFKLRLMYLKSYSNNTVAFFLSDISFSNYFSQRQPPRRVPRKRCSENMQQIYRKTPMLKCDFNKAIFRTPFPKITYGWLLSYEISYEGSIVMQLNYQQNSSIL